MGNVFKTDGQFHSICWSILLHLIKEHDPKGKEKCHVLTLPSSSWWMLLQLNSTVPYQRKCLDLMIITLITSMITSIISDNSCNLILITASGDCRWCPCPNENLILILHSITKKCYQKLTGLQGTILQRWARFRPSRDSSFTLKCTYLFSVNCYLQVHLEVHPNIRAAYQTVRREEL